MPGPRPVSVAMHTWMVTYDISDDRTRQQVANALAGYGNRVQYSVFECHLNEREFAGLRQRIADLVDHACDQIRWYPLCRPCHGRVVQQGNGMVLEDEGFYLV